MQRLSDVMSNVNLTLHRRLVPAGKALCGKELLCGRWPSLPPHEEEAIKLLNATQEMLAQSNLHLHKIASNKVEDMKAFPSEDLAKELKNLDLNTGHPPVQRSLGVSRDMTEDVFISRLQTR